MSRQLRSYHMHKSENNKIYLIRSDLCFNSKVALKEYLCKVTETIINREVTPANEHYLFFCDMIDRHHELKYEHGMNFRILDNDGYNLSPDRSKSRTPYRRCEKYRCYVWIPSMGKWYSFSLFNKCVNGKQDSVEVLKTKAYRKAIESQIQMARRARRWLCEKCGSTRLLEMDHYPVKFSQIVKEYCILVPVTEQNPDSFAEHHLKVANYRLLCQVCHRES